MRIGVFHPGTQHSWQTALAFQEAGMLGWYATSAFYDPARWPYKLERCVPRKMAAQLTREFHRRHHPLLEPAKVRQFGLWEWAEAGLHRLGHHRLADYCNERGNRAFGRQTIRLIEREPVEVVWGYNTSSLEVFQWAKQRGIRCVLDQTIGHPAAQKQIMLTEQERHPEQDDEHEHPVGPEPHGVAPDLERAERECDHRRSPFHARTNASLPSPVPAFRVAPPAGEAARRPAAKHALRKRSHPVREPAGPRVEVE